MDAERFTRLDRLLIAEQQASNEFADLRPDRDMLETARRNRALLIARARKLDGRLAGVANLASGRFAMIEYGLGFQLVPWQPVLEKRLDHYISGVRRDDWSIDWEFSRKRQIGHFAVYDESK